MSDAVAPFYLDLEDGEIETLKDTLERILRGGQLMLGPETERFEAEFASYIGVEHAVSVSSGTAALEILLRIHGCEGKKVAVPSNTNFATAAAVLHAGGTPVWLDMDPETFMPSLAMLAEAHEREGLAGCAIVHIGGLISPEFEAMARYCRERGIFLIEDAAHAHGSRIGGRSAGSLADGGAFSFFPTKVMTTMDGGMITTNDPEVSYLARSYRNQGKRGAKYGSDHSDLGASWRINELGAAMGSIQLAKLDAMLERRGRAAARYGACLEKLGVPYCRYDHMDRASQYKLIVQTKGRATIGELKDRFRALGVIMGGGVYERACHQQSVFAGIALPPGGLPNTEAYCPAHVCPPLTSGLSEQDIDRVIDAMSEVFGEGRNA